MELLNGRRGEQVPALQFNIPKDLEAESAVLGACLLETEALIQAVDILTPQMFYDGRNMAVFKAMVELYTRSEPVDLVSVNSAVRSEGIANMTSGEIAMYLMQLSSGVASGANIAFHSRLVAEKYILRSMMQLGGWLVKKSTDDSTDPFSLLSQTEDLVFKVARQNVKQDIVPIANQSADFLKSLEQKMAQPKSIIGLTSGFPSLDYITKGFRPADLILIAGRPAMGKTILMMNIARHMAMNDSKRVLVFSLEMTRERLMGRMVSEITGIPATLVEQGMIDKTQFGQIQELVGRISKSGLIIDDSSNLTISEIRTKTRKIMHEKGLDAVFVDYLQIIAPPINAGRMQPTQIIDEVSRGLTTLAKDLKIPVFAVSQLSRANEQRANKRPSLSDLRQSGQLEQDASVVIFVHRPEFYNEFEDENGESTRDKAYLLMAKHRHGGLSDVRVNYVQTCYKFVDESIHPDMGESKPKFAPSERFKDFVDIVEPEKDSEIPF